MAKRQKPPGYENWTWEEIRCGRKLSKQEKRIRKLAKHMGASEGENGRIVPPKPSENPGYWLLFGGMLIFMIVMAVMFPKGCAHR